MIKSFKDKVARAVFEGDPPARLRSIAKATARKLDMLDAAVSLNDLRSPPGNRLEALKGDRARASIRSASMTNGGSVSSGTRAPKRLRS